jgi:hypothetical protein
LTISGLIIQIKTIGGYMDKLDKFTTNQVKQILMNELGLTRESIRQLTTEVVTEVVVKYMDNMEKSGNLQRIVEMAFDKKYRDPNSYYGNFKSVLHRAAEKAANEFIEKNISLKTI